MPRASWVVVITAILAYIGCDDDEPIDKRKQGYSLCLEVDSSLCVGHRSTYPPDDELRLVNAWRAACDQSVWSACTSLGVLYEEGRVVRRVPAAAVPFFTKACNGGDGEACFRMSRLYERGDVGSIKMPALARDMRAKACAKGDVRGCADAGEAPFIAGMYLAVDGGLIQNTGDLEFNVAGRLRLLRARGVPLAQKCTDGDGRACNDIGWNYQNGIGGFPKEPVHGAGFYQRACDRGNTRGCDNLGWVFQKGIGVERDDKRAFQAYARACDGNDANACNNLGWLHRNGLGTPRNEVLAAPLFEKACDADNKFGCANLAWLYFYGRGVAKDLTKAETLYRRACALGYRDACQSVKKFER